MQNENILSESLYKTTLMSSRIPSVLIGCADILYRKPQTTRPVFSATGQMPILAGLLPVLDPAAGAPPPLHPSWGSRGLCLFWETASLLSSSHCRRHPFPCRSLFLCGAPYNTLVLLGRFLLPHPGVAWPRFVSAPRAGFLWGRLFFGSSAASGP